MRPSDRGSSVMRAQSLRIRFILAYAGLIVLGFGGLALLAGQQISSAARRDYELRLSNEAVLVARGLAEIPWNSPMNAPSAEEMEEVLADFKLRKNTRIQLFLSGRRSGPGMFGHMWMRSSPDQNWPLPEDLEDYPELVAASWNAVAVDQRADENGDMMLYAAAPVAKGMAFLGYVQLIEPSSTLQRAITRRWVVLGVGVAGITLVALLASTGLSTSLIRPLEVLRESAARFADGELSHRIDYRRQDEIGKVASAFNQMADQVESIIEEQRAFAANASHELRTPLTTMRLRTEALRHEATLDGEVRERYIAELDDELHRLSKLVEALVELSRFDAGRARLGDERIGLARFARSLYTNMAKTADQQGVDLILELAEERRLLVRGSLNHLTILFRNILENAIKYTPSGGRVVWRIAGVARQAVLVVEDTGQGIAPEHLPHIFERFYRADKTRSRAVPGTGLGLSLAKSIVEAYGGQIAITSSGMGQGTTVTVRWPLDFVDR